MQIEWCVYVFGLLTFKLITCSAAQFFSVRRIIIHPAIDIRNKRKDRIHEIWRLLFVFVARLVVRRTPFTGVQPTQSPARKRIHSAGLTDNFDWWCLRCLCTPKTSHNHSLLSATCESYTKQLAKLKSALFAPTHIIFYLPPDNQRFSSLTSRESLILRTVFRRSAHSFAINRPRKKKQLKTLNYERLSSSPLIVALTFCGFSACWISVWKMPYFYKSFFKFTSYSPGSFVVLRAHLQLSAGKEMQKKRKYILWFVINLLTFPMIDCFHRFISSMTEGICQS